MAIDKGIFEAAGSLAPGAARGSLRSPLAQPEDPSELHVAYADAIRANDDAHHAIEVLMQRIDPVLMPDMQKPEVPAATPRDKAACSVVFMFWSLADRNRFLTARIEALLARVGI